MAGQEFGQGYALTGRAVERPEVVLAAVRDWARKPPWRWAFPKKLRQRIDLALLTRDLKAAKEAADAAILANLSGRQFYVEKKGLPP